LSTDAAQGTPRACGRWQADGMPRVSNAVSAELVALIRAQSGMVARWQIREHGVPLHVLRDLLRGGRWRVCSPGVYAAFTGPLGRSAELWAALLHSSRRPRRTPGVTHLPDAVLSHGTAAELYGFAERCDPLIHVTVPSSRRRPKSISGVEVHFSADLARTRHPVLWPPRTRVDETALDLALAARDVGTAIDWLRRACGRRLTTPERLARALGERRRVRWRAELRYALRDVGDGTHNLFEVRYHRDVERAHGLPKGSRRLVRSHGDTVVYDDVAYEDHSTVVHLDGRVHEHQARSRDMSRDNAATVEGGDPLRYGWRDVTGSPCAVAAQVARVLMGNGWQGGPHGCGRPGCPVTALGVAGLEADAV
jgi:very-short-patch-repair endonuclease